MPAMNEATCPKCGKRFGWIGRVVAAPACPRCGQVLDKASLERTAEKLAEAERKFIEEEHARAEGQ